MPHSQIVQARVNREVKEEAAAIISRESRGRYRADLDERLAARRHFG